ncbi:MAG TPA: hypothetical protein VLA92_03330 [Candidatus Saccharimonadales bacterium]|nr:hypothetical protein [Candidatus Saccharimonadales bacterium]
MSEALLDSPEAVFEALEGKIIANNLSKFPEFEGIAYSDVLEMVGNTEIPIVDRLRTVADFAGTTSLTEELVAETEVLRLCALGRESEVRDPSRLAAYARSDANQERDARSERTLDYYLENGIEVIFDPEARAKARRLCDLDERDVPLIEKLKAQRLFDINGFSDSRVMYAVHDMIDHAWLFDQMRDNGIMDRYSDFLTSIDMKDSAFLYSRQAELLASVGFGARRWSVAQAQGERMVFKPHDLASMLGSIDDERTADAAQMLQEMSPHEQQQAVYMIENMAVQLTDERRRWGAVKQTQGEQHKPMDLLDPVHVALMLETLRMLQQSQGYSNVQLQATGAVEQTLREAIDDPGSQSSIHIPVPRGIVSEPKLVVSGDHEAWIRHNLSVSTSYNRIG